MRFNVYRSVTISLEELETLLPENAKKLITEECHVDSITDLLISVDEDRNFTFASF